MDTLTQVELPISEVHHQQAWHQSQGYSTPRAQWNAYLNQVCLETFLPWLQAEYAPRAQSSLQAWELVNGCAISWNDKRLVLIPDQHVDTREFRVPQEWVDIPSWIGDYYLAVQVDPDDLIIRVWGYTTHEHIKAIADYDADDRAYYLDAQALVEDITVLWVVRQLNPDELTRTAVAELAAVPELQAENLLQRLATVPQPRFEVPFTVWGALLETRSWRERLHRLRQTRESSASLMTNLRDWLNHSFTASWQAIEDLLNPEELAAIRQTQVAEPTWTRRVKVLDLPAQPILLMMALTPEEDDRISVKVQVRPVERSLCLPLDLTLALISAAGDRVQSVQARDQDNSIQLKQFKCPVGTQFSLQLALEEDVVTEAFQC
jgi:hypothetical protein